MKKTFLPLFLCLLLLLSACGKSAAPAAPFEGLELTVLKAGKADCLLLRMDDAVLMNDTADPDDANAIKALLKKKGIEKIDVLLISHYDKDHIGSAPELLKAGLVKRLLLPIYYENTTGLRAVLDAAARAGITPELVKEPLSFPCGKGTVTVSPPEKTYYENDNNYSLIASVEYGDVSLLLTGDALKERMEEFIASPECLRRYDVIKAPHHGDYYKALGDFIAKAKPKSILVTDGSGTVESKLYRAAEKAGAVLYFSSEGSITVTSDGKNISVTR